MVALLLLLTAVSLACTAYLYHWVTRLEKDLKQNYESVDALIEIVDALEGCVREVREALNQPPATREEALKQVRERHGRNKAGDVKLTGRGGEPLEPETLEEMAAGIRKFRLQQRESGGERS